jgi:hypothetical protein
MFGWGEELRAVEPVSSGVCLDGSVLWCSYAEPGRGRPGCGAQPVAHNSLLN